MDEALEDDPPTPRQAPKLSEVEVSRTRARDTQQARAEWLMSPPGAPELQTHLDAFDRPAWHQEAACRGMNTAMFIPRHGESAAAARAVCAGCPVRQECLEAGVADAELVGVWAARRRGSGWRCGGGGWRRWVAEHLPTHLR